MQYHAESIESQAFLQDSEAPAFRLFVVYDSQDASATAAATSDFVTHELGEDILVDKLFWNARTQTTPPHREEAVSHAAQADMVIVALSHSHSAPAIKEWARQWQQQRQQDGGLLAVLPQDGAETSTDLIDYLREAALSANMDFLCRSEENPRF